MNYFWSRIADDNCRKLLINFRFKYYNKNSIIMRLILQCFFGFLLSLHNSSHTVFVLVRNKSKTFNYYFWIFFKLSRVVLYNVCRSRILAFYATCSLCTSKQQTCVHKYTSRISRCNNFRIKTSFEFDQTHKKTKEFLCKLFISLCSFLDLSCLTYWILNFNISILIIILFALWSSLLK